MRMLVVVAVLLLGLGMVQAQEDATSEAPYLYYYSDVLNAFVVERADGSDSRMLWEQYTAGATGIDISPGFSPDGNWFGWSQWEYVEGQEFVWATHFSELASGVVRRLPAEIIKGDVSWTPIENTVLIAESPLRMGEDQAPFASYTLYDLNAERMLWTYRYPNAETGTTREIGWSEGGDFAFAYWVYNADAVSWDTYIVTISRDGSVNERKLEGVAGVSSAADGWAVYGIGREALGGANAFSGETFRIEIPDLYRQMVDELPAYLRHRRALHMTWSPGGEYAMLYEWHPPTGGQGSTPSFFWLLSIPDQRIALIDDEAYLNSAYFAPVSTASEDHDIVARWSWSPDERFVVFQPEPSTFALLDVASGSISQIPVNLMLTDAGQYRGAARWSPHSDALYIDLLRGNDVSADIVTYEVANGQTEYAPLPQYSFEQSSFSPSGRYLTVYSDFYDAALLIDRSSGEHSTLSPHSASTIGTQVLQWSADESWIIIGDSTCISGGCPAYFATGITHVEGTYWREMGVCNGLCANWLPEQVNVHLLPPGASDSVVITPVELDYDVEFAYGSQDLMYQIACDATDKTALLILERQTQEMLYRLHNQLPCAGEGGGVRFTLSPDERWLATVPTHASPMSFWEAESGELILRLPGDTFDLWFSEDGTRLYTRSRRAVLVWDVNELLRRAGMES